ncbi:MAG: DUF2283 domain-containing protein [Capsulimonas sp.]|jgi:uncharacterized protein YuzE|uniref:DUF2283 domain-containing protein n=1 Tax=Capsulimonas sp. TaxID=2494211 RepID=UPI00326766CE
MKVTYDSQSDRVRILFTNAPIERSAAEASGLTLDYDDKGEVVGLELAQASHRLHDPRAVEFVEACDGIVADTFEI